MAEHIVTVTSGVGGYAFPNYFSGEPNENKTISIYPHINYAIRSVTAYNAETYDVFPLTASPVNPRTGRYHYDFAMPDFNLDIFVEFEPIETVIPVTVSYTGPLGRIYTTSFGLLYRDENDIGVAQSVSFLEWSNENEYIPVHSDIITTNTSPPMSYFFFSPVEVTATVEIYTKGTTFIGTLSNVYGVSDNIARYIGIEIDGVTYNTYDIFNTGLSLDRFKKLYSISIRYEADGGFNGGFYSCYNLEKAIIGRLGTNTDSPTDFFVRYDDSSEYTWSPWAHSDDSSVKISFHKQWSRGLGGGENCNLNFMPIMAKTYPDEINTKSIGYRPGIISGKFGIINNRNVVTRVWTGAMIQLSGEENYTFYNPILNESFIFAVKGGWKYDFSSRTYTLFTSSGTILVTFGDYYVVIRQGGNIYRMTYVI